MARVDSAVVQNGQRRHHLGGEAGERGVVVVVEMVVGGREFGREEGAEPHMCWPAWTVQPPRSNKSWCDWSGLFPAKHVLHAWMLSESHLHPVEQAQPPAHPPAAAGFRFRVSVAGSNWGCGGDVYCMHDE